MLRILIVRPDRVGDVTTVTPLVREIKNKYPDAFIATLTKPSTASILENNPNIDLILKDNQESFWKNVRAIRRCEFTHGFLLWPNERSAYLMFFGGIRYRVGVGSKLFQLITGMKSISRNKYIPLRHETDYSMDFGRKLGITTDNLQPEIFLTPKEKTEAKNFFKLKGILSNEKVVIVHTGSLSSAPNWSEQKYLQFINSILSDDRLANVKVFLTAREMSDEFIDSALKLSPRVFNIVKETDDLRMLIKVISNASSLIGSSTGPLHLASALNINCIGLYCCEPMRCVKRWGAISTKAVNIEISEDYCKSNCSPDKKTCAFENGISIERVIQILIKQLSEG